MNHRLHNDAWLFSVLGIILILLFIANLINDLMLDEGYDSLWICHVSILLLALGLFLKKTALVQMALLWIIIGVFFWFLDSISNYFSVTSTLSHVASLVIGLYAINRLRAVSQVWYWALGYFLFLQVLSRISTPAEANVNIAHNIWHGWNAIFNSYWHYWMFTTASAVFVLWLLEKILVKLFPGNLVNEKGN